MEDREMREKTPSKHILQSIHNKLGLATTCDKSPKRENHKFSTPKNKVRMAAKNPFEPLLHEVMHTNIMSPSVFAVLPNKAPIDNDQFCWSIEELASFQPIDIEKSPFVQSEATDHVFEAISQAKINKFFSAKTILPSPAGPAIVTTSLLSTCPSSSSSMSPLVTPSPPATVSHQSSSGTCNSGPGQKRRKLCATVACQTNLSLPAVLPEALRRMLRPYMKCDAYGQLMGQLYPDEYSSSEEGGHLSPHKALQDTLPLANSPPDNQFQEKVRSDQFTKNKWEVSPIVQDEDSGSSGTSADRFMRSRRSVAKLDFSAGHMSVDTSQQLCRSGIPDDDLDGLSFHNNSLHIGNTPKNRTYAQSPSSPANNDEHVQLRSSAIDSPFSRMEDDYISFRQSRDASFEATGASANCSVANFDMDISFSNTPKSRSASATRRRLCDSFASFNSDDEGNCNGRGDGEGVHGVGDRDDTVEIIGSPMKYKSNDLITKNDELSSITDTGYNTASTFEESSLYFEKNTNLFASTPTKVKIPFPSNE